MKAHGIRVGDKRPGDCMSSAKVGQIPPEEQWTPQRPLLCSLTVLIVAFSCLQGLSLASFLLFRVSKY